MLRSPESVEGGIIYYYILTLPEDEVPLSFIKLKLKEL